MAVTYINFVKADGLPYTNKAAQLLKPAKVAQTKEQMDRSNRLACGYSSVSWSEHAETNGSGVEHSGL